MSHRYSEHWEDLGEDTSETDAVNAMQSANPWDTAVKAIVPAVASAYQQAQLTKINVARMQQGLQPLTAQQYSASYQVPAAQVQFGMDEGTKKLFMWGALGLVGLYIAKSQRWI